MKLMTSWTHLTLSELEAGLPEISRSPTDQGVLKLIVRRPHVEEREVIEYAELDTKQGLVGDNHMGREISRKADNDYKIRTQITITNSRVIDLIAGMQDRWPLAGDQLYIDMDLSTANMPAGTQFELGSAVLEVSADLHTGCKKFAARFGLDALKYVNSSVGKELGLRGINARVVRPGLIQVGQVVTKVETG